MKKVDKKKPVLKLIVNKKKAVKKETSKKAVSTKRQAFKARSAKQKPVKLHSEKKRVEKFFGQLWAQKVEAHSITESDVQFLKRKELAESAFDQDWDDIADKYFVESNFLVLGPRNTVISWVIKTLQKQGVPFTFIDVEELLQNPCSIQISDDAVEVSVRRGDKELSLDFPNVYLELPGILNEIHWTVLKPGVEEMILLQRWKEFFKAWEISGVVKKWWPGPPSELGDRAQRKVEDLLWARKAGFKVPEILMTNDREHVERMLADYPEGIVFHDYSTRAFFEGREARTFPKKEITGETELSPMLAEAPVVFQKKIFKDKDIRAIVLGPHVFAMSLKPKNNRQILDWRGESLSQFDVEIAELPDHLKDALIERVAELNLNLAAIDCVIDKEGNWYFLEINRPGQWLFVEALTGQPILDTLAAIFI